jgi:hypothetical protein
VGTGRQTVRRTPTHPVPRAVHHVRRPEGRRHPHLAHERDPQAARGEVSDHAGQAGDVHRSAAPRRRPAPQLDDETTTRLTDLRNEWKTADADRKKAIEGEVGQVRGAQAQNPQAVGEQRGNDEASKTWAQTNPRNAGRPQKSLIGIPWRYALRCIDDLGLILRAEVIWSKPNGLPESVTDRVRRSHEQWFHFTLQPRYFSAVDEIRETYAPSTPTQQVRAPRLGHPSGEQR